MINDRLTLWVNQCEGLCAPDQVNWCDNSNTKTDTDTNWEDSIAQHCAVSTLTVVPEEVVGMDDLLSQATDLTGALAGRTMYVASCVGTLSTGEKIVSVEVTDSPALVTALRRRYRIDRAEATELSQTGDFTAALQLAFPARRFIAHTAGTEQTPPPLRACRERAKLTFGTSRNVVLLPTLSPPDGARVGEKPAAPCTVCRRICPKSQQLPPY